MQNVSQYVHNIFVSHTLFIMISVISCTRVTLGSTRCQTFQLKLWLQLFVILAHSFYSLTVFATDISYTCMYLNRFVQILQNHLCWHISGIFELADIKELFLQFSSNSKHSGAINE